MRIPALSIVALGTLLAMAPASAQTYGNTNFPVCLQVFGRFNYFDCSYMSIEQCRPSAAARAAQCVTNPYYAAARVAPGSRYHRRHVY
jgi:hypothetical protein